MRVGDFDTDERVMVVAEIGNNHEGSLDVARELVSEAAAAGAHAVKLQTFDPSRLVRRRDEVRFRQLSSYRLPAEAVEELSRLARDHGLLFMSTPFDPDSAAFLAPLVDAVKVASGDNDFPALLDAVAETERPAIVSSGLVGLSGIRAAKERVERRWEALGVDQEIAVLQCVSAYPLRPSAANLAAIGVLREELGCTVGYSDHTIGVEACVLAAAMGARILEKHFTLRHGFSSFRDHQLSLEPAEMRTLVDRVEEVRIMTGRPEKVPQPDEEATAAAVRRAIAAAADLPEGHRLRLEDLTWLRPRDGLAPGQEDRLLDRRLTRALSFGESILPSDVE